VVFAASGSTSLPLSDRNAPWDAGAARKTLKGAADFAAAHFWKDPNGPADQIGSYKLPFAQRVNGTMTAIWRGVTAGAARLDQTQGIDKQAVQGKMGAYYKKAAAQFKDPSIKAPWDGSNSYAVTPGDKHQFMDDGYGSCMECGGVASMACHDVSMVAASGMTWRAVLCVEGEPTEDGRLLAPGSITWRTLPLTLLAQLETAAGHDGAEVCGRIDRIWRDGSNIMGEGVFDSGEFGLEAARLVGDQVLRGISVDLAVLEYELQTAPDADDQQLDIADGVTVIDDADQLFVVTDGVIGAATVCAFQAIAGATIEVVASAGSRAFVTVRSPFANLDALTAATVATPVHPPADWFDDPKLEKPTLLTVTPDGRVFGHVAPWRGCHTGYLGRCVSPPRSRSGYSGFHVGRIHTEDGSLISVGRLTLATGHADTVGMTTAAARAHYDNTGRVAAFVRAGEDEHGIWVAGALRSEATPAMVQDLMANPLSGDWRNGEMIAAHAVPVPGFPILQASAIGPDGEEETVLILTSTVGLEDTPEVDLGARSRVLAARAHGGIEALAALAHS
jgi:hypothetical protein